MKVLKSFMLKFLISILWDPKISMKGQNWKSCWGYAKGLLFLRFFFKWYLDPSFILSRELFFEIRHQHHIAPDKMTRRTLSIRTRMHNIKLGNFYYYLLMLIIIVKKFATLADLWFITSEMLTDFLLYYV